MGHERPVACSCIGAVVYVRAGVSEELLRHGYRPGSAAKQLQLMAHLSRWMEAQDLEPSALDRVEVERFV